LILFAVAVLVFTDYGKTETIIIYDCKDADWLPNFPEDLKKECQRIYYEQWKLNQDKKKLTVYLKDVNINKS
jgi:hypothetical protein